jgi:hypothetical protein
VAIIRCKRGTRAQVDAAAAAGQLLAGEPYLLTDESALCVGLGPSTYADVRRQQTVQALGDTAGTISLDFLASPPDVVSARLTGPATIAIVLPATGVAQLRLDLTSDDGSHTAVLQLPSLPEAPALRWLGGVEDDLSPPAGLTREYWITARPVSAEFPGGEIRMSAADYWSPA